MEPNSRSHSPRFTLIHGVIVGVIFTTAYVVVRPVYLSARTAAGKVACMSNMKRLATGQFIYASDNNDAVAPYYTFDGPAAQAKLTAGLYPYLKDNAVFLCSESARAKADRNNSKQEIDHQHFPLILKHVGKDNLLFPDKVPSPDKTAWMHDPIIKIARTKDGEEIETNHKKNPNGFNVMFVDSHVSFVPTLKGSGREGMNTDGVWLK